MGIISEVTSFIEENIRPALQSHGGDVDFVAYDESGGVLTVRLTGACGSCPHAQETLRGYVEKLIRQKFPEINKVVRADG